MTRGDALYDRMCQKVFGNVFFFYFVALAVLLMVSRWNKLAEGKGEYMEQLYYCTGSNYVVLF